MSISDEELRAFVFQEVARHLGRDGCAPPVLPIVASAISIHLSHDRLSMAPAVAAGESCVIEPAVRCNNCGYCKSLGH